MSLRKRLAVAPASTSASMTIEPPTMCKAPAKRSKVATSALRQQVFVTSTRLSSSFTAAVIAIVLVSPSSGQNRIEGASELVRVMAIPEPRDVRQDQLCTPLPTHFRQFGPGLRRTHVAFIGQHHIAPQLRGMRDQRLDVLGGREVPRLTLLRIEVQHDYLPTRSRCNSCTEFGQHQVRHEGREPRTRT